MKVIKNNTIYANEATRNKLPKLYLFFRKGYLDTKNI